jgi:hypothetical protein
MEKITAYKTADGVIHENLDSAIESEQAYDLGNWLFEHPEILWNTACPACPHEVAAHITAEFKLTRKPPFSDKL